MGANIGLEDLAPVLYHVCVQSQTSRKYELEHKKHLLWNQSTMACTTASTRGGALPCKSCYMAPIHKPSAAPLTSTGMASFKTRVYFCFWDANDSKSTVTAIPAQCFSFSRLESKITVGRPSESFTQYTISRRRLMIVSRRFMVTRFFSYHKARRHLLPTSSVWRWLLA